MDQACARERGWEPEPLVKNSVMQAMDGNRMAWASDSVY